MCSKQNPLVKFGGGGDRTSQDPVLWSIWLYRWGWESNQNQNLVYKKEEETSLWVDHQQCFLQRDKGCKSRPQWPWEAGSFLLARIVWEMPGKSSTDFSDYVTRSLKQGFKMLFLSIKKNCTSKYLYWAFVILLAFWYLNTTFIWGWYLIMES